MTGRISDAERLTAYIDAWQQACADFIALARAIPAEQWDLPTDLEGWSVKDNVAHTAHLESVLAGSPEERIEVAPAPHIKNPTGYYTEQGVLSRRDRDMAELVDELERSVAARSQQLNETPPSDGSAKPAKTPGDIGWDTETLLRNRPLDVWMHEQDIRRAIGRPGGYDSAAAAHTLRVLTMSLPLVVGKRVAPPAGTTVLFEVPEAGITAGVVVGDDGRARLSRQGDDPAVRITFDPESFVVLGGGRRGPDRVRLHFDGDRELGAQVVAAMGVTP